MTALVRQMFFVRGGSQRDRPRRDGVVRAVMLADAEDVEADPVVQLDLLDEVAKPLRGTHARANVRERVEAEFHRVFPVGRVCERLRTIRAKGAGDARKHSLRQCYLQRRAVDTLHGIYHELKDVWTPSEAADPESQCRAAARKIGAVYACSWWNFKSPEPRDHAASTSGELVERCQTVPERPDAPGILTCYGRSRCQGAKAYIRRRCLLYQSGV